MDIYQIWTTYNKQWSKCEMLAFTGVMILVCIVVAVCAQKEIEYHTGNGNFTIRSFYGNCLWLNGIYQNKYRPRI